MVKWSRLLLISFICGICALGLTIGIAGKFGMEFDLVTKGLALVIVTVLFALWFGRKGKDS